MADPEPPSGGDDAGSSGGLASLLDSTPRVLGAVTALIGAVTGLLIALNKAGLLGNDSGGAATTHVGDSTTADASLFGPKTQGGGRGQVRRDENGTLYVTAAEPGHGVRVLADLEDPPADVSLSARVRWVSGQHDWSFALMCRFRDARNYYFLGVIPSKRQYNIGTYRNGRLASLTGLQRSDAIREGDNNVTARCVGSDPTILTLVVNGELLQQKYVQTGIDSGNVGLRAGSSAGTVTCAFDEFALKRL